MNLNIVTHFKKTYIYLREGKTMKRDRQATRENRRERKRRERQKLRERKKT